jgi:polyhydroxyalkanoate synthesis regulator phasin
MRSTKRLLAGGAAALGAGILAVGPLRAMAQDDGDGENGWVDNALDELVEDGTLTQDQADAVADALRDARPDHFPGFGPWSGRGPFAVGGSLLEEAADTIGIEVDDLLDAVRDGQTIAEVAEGEGVDPQTVIDAIVAQARERLDEAVADGRIDQEDADEHLADLDERITEFVNEGFAALPVPDGGFFRERVKEWGPWHHGGPWHERSIDEDDESPDTSDTPDSRSPDSTSPDSTSPDSTSPNTTDGGS